jgi:hypothetical protein
MLEHLFQGTTGCRVRFPEEHNYTVRKAKISILLRSVKGSTKWMLTANGQHWCIIAEFENRTIAYEIMQVRLGEVR